MDHYTEIMEFCEANFTEDRRIGEFRMLVNKINVHATNAYLRGYTGIDDNTNAFTVITQYVNSRWTRSDITRIKHKDQLDDVLRGAMMDGFKAGLKAAKL